MLRAVLCPSIHEVFAMRVFPCMLALALLCTTATGCSLFKKNTNGAQGPEGGGAAPAKFPGARNSDPLMPPTPPPTFPANGGANGANNQATNTSSVLAGTVVDAYHRPMSNAYIRWVNLDEKDTGAPIDVSADQYGHFIIQGVKPGASYKLIARTKQGEKMLAGTVLTSAPNVRVLIPIREDLANDSTPPIPNSPAAKDPPPAQGEGKNGSGGTGWSAGHATDPSPKGPTETPTLNVPSQPVANPAPGAGSPSFVPGIADGPAKDRLPMLTIPPLKTPAPQPPKLPPLAPGESKLDTGPTRIPSCVLVGNHLENLALKDSRGQTWEYKKQGTGKLILIDFWGTHCVYCRDSMPTLNRLQTQYGSRGLEVIGIAIEPGKDERREAEAVNKMCVSMQVSYRQLMGHVGSFDVGKNFKIEGLPTMILLSENGDIIWHHVGRPDPSLLSALERTIQSRLNNRAF
jgi:thiol-disulfide isomerase/thioredoxin